MSAEQQYMKDYAVEEARKEAEEKEARRKAEAAQAKREAQKKASKQVKLFLSYARFAAYYAHGMTHCH